MIDPPPPLPASHWTFKALFAFAALVAATILYFFLWGMSDGTVSAGNAGAWLLLVGVALGVPWGAAALAGSGRRLPAALLLGVLAVPGALAVLFLLLAIFSGARWN